MSNKSNNGKSEVATVSPIGAVNPMASAIERMHRDAVAETEERNKRIGPEAIDQVVNSLAAPTYKLGMRYAHFLAANSLDDEENSLRIWNELKDKAHLEAVQEREAITRIPDRVVPSAYFNRKTGRWEGRQAETYSGLKAKEEHIRRAMAKSKAQQEKMRLAYSQGLALFLQEQAEVKA